MLQYAEKFDDRGEIRWMPYLMYFHPADHRSSVVNTDRLGFRIADGPGATASAGGTVPDGPVNVIAGSSTVSASARRTTAPPSPPASGTCRRQPSLAQLRGRSHNSTQELLLFTLYRHLLPRIDRIVVFSGFNDLGWPDCPAGCRAMTARSSTPTSTTSRSTSSGSASGGGGCVPA
ncbi:hypothetical protein NKG94_01685 [Micromonospora sp. M12]